MTFVAGPLSWRPAEALHRYSFSISLQEEVPCSIASIAPTHGRRGRSQFLDGDFRIVRPGAFVRCAVTNVPIPLEELKYWSVDLQEAYASPQAVMQRLETQKG